MIEMYHQEALEISRMPTSYEGLNLNESLEQARLNAGDRRDKKQSPEERTESENSNGIGDSEEHGEARETDNVTSDTEDQMKEAGKDKDVAKARPDESKNEESSRAENDQVAVEEWAPSVQWRASDLEDTGELPTMDVEYTWEPAEVLQPTDPGILLQHSSAQTALT